MIEFAVAAAAILAAIARVGSEQFIDRGKFFSFSLIILAGILIYKWVAPVFVALLALFLILMAGNEAEEFLKTGVVLLFAGAALNYLFVAVLAYFAGKWTTMRVNGMNRPKWWAAGIAIPVLGLFFWLYLLLCPERDTGQDDTEPVA